MKEITKAIIKVMQEVKGMEKNSRVGEGRNAYDGTKDQDVKEVFNQALANNGLAIVPIDIQEDTTISRWEKTDKYGTSQKQSVFTKVKTKYLLLHTSGESIEIAGYGQGVDTQDKGAGKATTYALKNALLYTFLTPVGKMPDTDLDHSDNFDVPKPNPDPKPQPKELPWLNEGAEFEKFKKEGTPIAEIRKQYKVSRIIEAKLTGKKINFTTEIANKLKKLIDDGQGKMVKDNLHLYDMNETQRKDLENYIAGVQF